MKRVEVDYITRSLVNGHMTFEEGTDQIMELHDVTHGELKKLVRDLHNYVKSELQDATKDKMDKYETPYLEEKKKFLNKVNNILKERL